MKNAALRYFQTFAKKDIYALRELFSPDVTLRDWEISANGLEAVLEANSRIFTNVKKITVDISNVYQCGNTIIAEVDIALNICTTMRVVDIIEFENDGKISAIRAFKG